MSRNHLNKLNEEQIKILQLSDSDIENGKLINQNQLDRDDMQFLQNIVEKKELDKRLNDHQNGIGRTFTWEETIAIAEKKLAKRKV